MKSSRQASSDGGRIPRNEGGHKGNHKRRKIRIMARGGTIMLLATGICFLVPKAAAQPDKYSKDGTPLTNT